METKENSLELEAQSSKLEAHKEMTHADAVARLMGIMRRPLVKDRRDIAALNMAINQLVRRDRQTGQHYLNRAARKAAAKEDEGKSVANKEGK